MRSKIGIRIFIYMFGVAVIPVTFLYVYISSNYYDNLEEAIYYENEFLQQSSVNELESVLNKIEVSSNVCYDLGVQDILSENAETPLEAYNNQQMIDRTFRVNLELFKVFDVMKSLRIVNSFGNEYVIQQDNVQTHDMPIVNINPRELMKHYKNFDIIVTEGSQQYMYVRTINSIKRVGSKLGIVYISFDKENVLKLFPGYVNEKRGNILIENEFGKIIYSNVPKEMEKSKTLNDIKISRYELKNSKYKVTFYDNVDLLLKPVRELQTIALSIIAVSIVLVFILALLLSQNLTIPIRDLKQGIKKVADGKYNVNVQVKSRDELGELCHTFNLMANRIDVLVNEVFISNITEKEAVIAALTAQINPHFLYNTLDMMKSMAELENQNEIGEIAKALSNMFRYSTKNDVLVVTVEEEINNLKNYIKIIDERFGKKIHFKLDIKEEVLKDNMIKLCLQPLVENSIFHGLSERSNDGTIIIKIVDVNGLLEITVSDNGQGIEPNVLKKLQKDINDNKQINNREENNGHTSVGLRNINRRIRLYYGDTYGVFIESQYLEGTSVKLLIPLQNGKEFIC